MIESIPAIQPVLPLPSLAKVAAVEDDVFAAVYANILQKTDKKILQDRIEKQVQLIAESESKKQQLKNKTDADESPFAAMFAGMVKALQEVSNIEHRTNYLIHQYVDKKVSVEEVTMATAQLNVALTLTTTVMSSLSQALKEVYNTQI